METISFEEEKRITKQKVAVPLLWIAIAAMVMFFAAFTSAYIVSRESASWIDIELPQMFYISTAIIIISSVTMNWALTSAKKDNSSGIKNGVLLTLVLGFAFVLFQFLGWKALYEQKIVFAGKYSNPAGSYLYVITFMHFLHLFGGIIALFVVWFKSLKNRYNAQNLLGLKVCSIYWHFLDVLWIFLFLFLLFYR